MKRLIRARRKTVLAGAIAVLLAAGLGTWATDTWPFDRKDRYCWGAWKEDSGPGFLGDDAFFDGGGSRTSEETAPTPQRPRGECTVAIRSGYTSSDGDENVRDTTVTVAYGPAPKAAEHRLEWIDGYLGDRAMPLPDGLPGTTDGDKALLVLPKRCDTRDGRPTTVTLDSTSRLTWQDGAMPTDGGLGDSRSVAELLVSVANKGMEEAGCAPSKPLRVTSPALTLPEKEENYFSRACRIKGLDFDRKTARELEYQVGAVTRDLQSCSVRTKPTGDRYFDALMVAQPRLSALFDGTTGSKAPAPGWHGTGVFADGYKVVRADCAGRPLTFLMLAPSLPRGTTPYFTAFTNAVTQRIGCAPVAPGGSR
ncbi:hypothetical protein ABZ370_12840 [Streptomyces sp. NPDC005962]|uniref:hypothetical protein n=1 Tax=Streptomyces sp. NPDC005962 TaxID=3154466 RepID=UPI0033F7E6C4